MVCPIKEKDKRMYCLLRKYYESKKNKYILLLFSLIGQTMKYNISKNRLELHDSLSLENLGELIKMFNEELPPKSKKLVVDLKEVDSIDTAVVQFFLNFKINLEKQEKSIQFINLSESLKKDIDLLSLEGFFDETSHPGVK